MAEVVSMAMLVSRLGIELTGSNNASCPFCSNPGRRKTLNFNFEKEFFRCPICRAQGGVLHLYAMYQLGMDSLPTQKRERGKLAEQLRDFVGVGGPADQASPVTREVKRPPSVKVADDDTLHRVYSDMAMIPALQLRAEHRADLLKRGLNEEAIVRNGYRSLPDDPTVPDETKDVYARNGGDALRGKLFSWVPAKQVQFGLLIASILEARGHNLSGIPGFFKFGDAWCLKYTPGMLIPTRNSKGQIVLWQVRQKKEPKYMTLSCGSLPGAVTEAVSRCHFPLGNAPLSPNAPLIYIEGSLKADISCHLYGVPATFAGILGINTTKDLLNHSERFHTAGITTVINGLDMDRLTNPNVRQGSAALIEAFNERGFSVENLYWGTEYATFKLLALRQLARLRNITVDTDACTSVHEKLDCVAEALDQAGIDAFKMQGSGKKEKHLYWDPATKGMDDYLLSSSIQTN